MFCLSQAARPMLCPHAMRTQRFPALCCGALQVKAYFAAFDWRIPHFLVLTARCNRREGCLKECFALFVCLQSALSPLHAFSLPSHLHTLLARDASPVAMSPSTQLNHPQKCNNFHRLSQPLRNLTPHAKMRPFSATSASPA